MQRAGVAASFAFVERISPPAAAGQVNQTITISCASVPRVQLTALISFHLKEVDAV